MFILDTNVVSEIRKAQADRSARRAHPGVIAWAMSTPRPLMFLSVITLMEIELGILLLARRDTLQADHLRAWLTNVVTPEFRDRLLPVDAAVARLCAGLHVPNPRPERDALIAATALVHGMTVVTRDANGFAAMGVPVIDPWTATLG